MYDLLIIGAGPAGYVAGIRAGQLGMKTALIEKEHIGGMCVNWGCVPLKALMHSTDVLRTVRSAAGIGIGGIDVDRLCYVWKDAARRVQSVIAAVTSGIHEQLFRNSVELVQGEARILSEHSVSVSNRTLEASFMLIATGSMPGKLRFPLPEAKTVSLNRLLSLETLPDPAVVYGSGPVAVELAQFLAGTGNEVILLSDGKPLLASADGAISAFMEKRLKQDGIRILQAQDNIGFRDDRLMVAGEAILFDRLIPCGAREAVLPPSNIPFDTENGALAVNEYLQTNYANIYAAGDATGRSFLAHAASAQGLYTVNRMKGFKEPYVSQSQQLNMYTYPEVAQIGLTEESVEQAGFEYAVETLPLASNAKALIEGDTEGFVRILYEKRFGEVLGVQIVGLHATDLIAEASAIMQAEGTIYDIAKIVHAHPTVSEVFMGVGFGVKAKSLDFSENRKDF